MARYTELPFTAKSDAAQSAAKVEERLWRLRRRAPDVARLETEENGGALENAEK